MLDVQRSRPGDLANTFELPSYGRWDGGVFYERNNNLRATAYLENLFDIQYAASSIDRYQVFQGAPFNVRANMSFSY